MKDTDQQSATASAWTWSIEHSPLLNTYRWFLRLGYPNADAMALLSSAELPEELCALVQKTVERTRLWRSERAEIARELIAHIQDALEAERSPDQIIESFGNPKKVAKLLRRAAKRKRPLYWRTLRNIRRSLTPVFLVMFITYTGLAIRFYSGSPNIKHNETGMINAQNEAFAEDERAWPVYQEIITAWDLHTLDTESSQTEFVRLHNASIDYGDEAIDTGLGSYQEISTDHPQYSETVQVFKSFEPQFQRLREAAHRPAVGIRLGFEFEIIDNSDGTYNYPANPISDNPEENPSLINLLLPHLGETRKFANMLAFDAIIAARESDPQRVYDNLSSILAMSRHESFDQTLISDLVNTAVAQLAIKTLGVRWCGAIPQPFFITFGSKIRKHVLRFATQKLQRRF